MSGSFSLQSEDVASHFPSPCCNNVLESLHACPPHHLFISSMITGAQYVMTNDNNEGPNDGEDETTTNYLNVKQ